MNPLRQQLTLLLSPSVFLWSFLTVQRRTVGDLKRKDVFIELQPVRCVWSLMSPVTFMWHSIKEGEADKFFNKLTCFGQQVNYDVAAGLQYYGRNFAIWNDVKMSQTLSIIFSQQLCTEGENNWSHSRRSFALLVLTSWHLDELLSQTMRAH